MTATRVPRRPVILSLVLLVAVSTNAEAAASSLISHGQRTQKMVALTFDDGWSRSRCGSIASALRAYGVYLRSAPEEWRHILRGFPVADHTRSQRFLTRISGSSIRRQIRSNERIHEQVLGRPMMKVLRPPYAAYDARVLRIAGALGYRYTLLWDVSGGDTARGATVSSVIRNATRGRHGSVVLLHCGPGVTPAAVPAIIRSYRSRGFQLVRLDRLLGL